MSKTSRFVKVLTLASLLAVFVEVCCAESAVAKQQLTPRDFAADFDTAWKEIGSTYAYFDVKATRWREIPKLYRADVEAIRSREDLVAVLERVVDELYDPHAQLTTNTPTSFRLVPSGTDLWAEWRGDNAVVTEVRTGSDAEREGIRPGAIVIAINDTPIARAASERLGRSYPQATPAARDWALRSVLAGTHNKIRRLHLQVGSVERRVQLPARDQFRQAERPPVRISRLASGVAQIRFNDSIGDQKTIAAFDEALLAVRDAPALLIDLRDTPSGGNTSVARAILGRFVDRETPYQKHTLPAEEAETGVRRSWVELVSPRGSFIYHRPVAVLVGHWTGSMGEGLAIGFDATGRVKVIGTPMAALLGATYQIKLPNTGIGVNVPAEKLFHVNGTSRESFRPTVVVNLTSAAEGEDPVVASALLVLSQH